MARTSDAERSRRGRGPIRELWTATRVLIREDGLLVAAALAFHTSLSFAPLLVLLIWGMSFFGPTGREHVLAQTEAFLGPKAGALVEAVVENASDRPELGNWAGVLSLFALLVSASGVFAHLQRALNHLWGSDEKAPSGWLAWLRKRLLSFGMVCSLGLLAVLSLILSTLIAFITERTAALAPALEVVWRAVPFVTTLLITAVAVAGVLRFLPDVRLGWRDVVTGSLITALLLTLARTGLGLYLGQSSVGSAYGAAGSLLVLSMWAYVSSAVLLYGAELTRLRAERLGRVPEARSPKAGAVTPGACPREA